MTGVQTIETSAGEWRRFDDAREAEAFADRMAREGYLVGYQRAVDGLGGEHAIWFTKRADPRVIEFDPGHLPTGSRRRFDIATAKAEQESFSMVLACLAIGVVSGFFWREILRFVLGFVAR